MWKSFKAKARGVRQLTFPEWLMLVEAWWVLLGFYLVLSRVSYERLNSATSKTANENARASSDLDAAQRLSQLVGIAARLHLLPMTCLVKAFTLKWKLGRLGIPAELCIGANKTSSRIHAHAWVEIMGQAVGESEANIGTFKVFKPSERSIP